MSKPIPGTHLYPLTFMGFPLIDSSTIKLPPAAPSPRGLGSVGMASTPLPVSDIPGGAASPQLLVGEIPDQGCSHLATHPSAGTPGRMGMEAMAESCTFSLGKSLPSLSFPFPVAFPCHRGELHTLLTSDSPQCHQGRSWDAPQCPQRDNPSPCTLHHGQGVAPGSQNSMCGHVESSREWDRGLCSAKSQSESPNLPFFPFYSPKS